MSKKKEKKKNKLTWAEIHAFEIGLGDSLSRQSVNWEEYADEQPEYIKELKLELHYYKMGVFIPRAAIVSTILLLIWKLIESI